MLFRHRSVGQDTHTCSGDQEFEGTFCIFRIKIVMYAHIAFANHAPQMNKIDRCSGQPNLSCPIEKNAVSDRKIILSHFGQCFSIEVFIHDEKIRVLKSMESR